MIRVYKYGLLPPVAEADRVREQMQLANRYYNRLVEIEKASRASYRELRRTFHNVGALEDVAIDAKRALELALTELKQQRAATRSRSETAAQREKVKEAREKLKVASAAAKEAKRFAKNDPALRSASATLNERKNEVVRAARKASGVYWGTYLLIERAFEASKDTAVFDPGFRPFERSRSVGVQIQKGIAAAELFASDTRVQINPIPAEAWSGTRATRRRLTRTRLRLRVGSDERQPIFAEWPMIMHRPLPADAKVKWVQVTVSRIGRRERWEVHFTVDLPDTFTVEDCGHGKVAVDIGWRRVDGGLRVGWVHSDDFSSELLLHGRIVGGIEKADSLRSIRDRSKDRMQAWLAYWVKTYEQPQWFADAAPFLTKWRSPRRFARLLSEWSRQRFPGDELAFELLRSWLYNDNHLRDWEVSQRTKSQLRRKEEYREFAAQMARRYDTVVLEKMDKRQTQRNPLIESGEVAYAHREQKLACTSELVGALKNAFKSRGGRVIEVVAAGTSATCHECGAQNDVGDKIRHTCTSCGASWDRDQNAAKNILKRGERSGDENLVVSDSGDLNKAVSVASRASRRRRKKSSETKALEQSGQERQPDAL